MPFEFEDAHPLLARQSTVGFNALLRIENAHRLVGKHLIASLPEALFEQSRVALGIRDGNVDAIGASRNKALGAHLFQNAPMAHERIGGCQLFEFGQIVARKHDGNSPFAVKPLQKRAYLDDTARVEPRDRLIEDKDLGLPQKRHREPEALLHSHRKVFACAPLRVGEAHELQKLRNHLFARNAFLYSVVLEVLLDAQVRIEPRLLDDGPHPRTLPFEIGLRVFAEEAHLAPARKRKPA